MVESRVLFAADYSICGRLNTNAASTRGWLNGFSKEVLRGQVRHAGCRLNQALPQGGGVIWALDGLPLWPSIIPPCLLTVLPVEVPALGTLAGTYTFSWDLRLQPELTPLAI